MEIISGRKFAERSEAGRLAARLQETGRTWLPQAHVVDMFS